MNEQSLQSTILSLGVAGTEFANLHVLYHVPHNILLLSPLPSGQEQAVPPSAMFNRAPGQRKGSGDMDPEISLLWW